MVDKNEKEEILKLWLENVSETKIAAIMDMRVEEVHNIIYMPSHFNSLAEFLRK